MKYQLTSDLYCLPKDNHFIVYLPKKRIAFLANTDMVTLIEHIRNNDELLELSDAALKIIGYLTKTGVINGAPQEDPGNTKRYTFSPTSVTLFPSYNCNLRCVYCYSSGGDSSLTMPFEVAAASIDLICENAKQTRKKSIQVNFHGGGEPTINWDLFVGIVEYAQQAAKRVGLSASSAMASNCILNSKQADWVVRNLRHVNVSLDGTAEIQDLQRPMKSGKGSFDLVYKTLKFFESQNFSYGIRSTVTDYSVHYLSEIVTYFCQEFKSKSIHLEPLFECGRCLVSNAKAPENSVFLAEFLKAQSIAAKNRTDLYYSGSRIKHLTSTFCGAAGRNFIVLPDGNVTACNEVCYPNDPRSDQFFYGKYDYRDHRFAISQEKLDILASRTVQNIQTCQACFLKWHCAGDCLAKAALVSGDIFDPKDVRCWLNQEITKQNLFQMLEEGSEPILEADPC